MQIPSFIQKNKIILLVLLCITIVSTAFLTRDTASANSDFTPSDEVQKLDAKLLLDVQGQEISFEEKSLCMLECSKLSEQDIRKLLVAENINYEHCEKANCHFISYTIESHTEDGRAISFKLDSGEDGNEIRDLQVAKADCECKDEAI